MSGWKRLEAIDRRVIFLIMAVGIILPMIFPLKLPIAVTPEVQAVYDRMESLQPGDVIMLGCQYDPSTKAEMQPMAFNILRHAFRKKAKVVAVCLLLAGSSQVDKDLNRISDEMGMKRGVDWAYLGYKPYPATVIMAMGQDFRIPFPKDYYDQETDSLPIMRGIKNLNAVKFVVDVDATSAATDWLQYGAARYQFPFALGVTAVMAADYYAYLQSNQTFGLLGGLKGAAEYEALMKEAGDATRVMNIQSVVHCVIVAFIIIGNIAFLMTGGRMRMGGRA